MNRPYINQLSRLMAWKRQYWIWLYKSPSDEYIYEYDAETGTSTYRPPDHGPRKRAARHFVEAIRHVFRSFECLHYCWLALRSKK